MSVKGIIMFLGMNDTRLERKMLIILDFDNGFLATYLPLCSMYITYKSILMQSSRNILWCTNLNMPIVSLRHLRIIKEMYTHVPNKVVIFGKISCSARFNEC